MVNLLITLEGIDGTGKTTVCDLLSKKFPYAVMTKEPQDKLLIEWYGHNSYMELYAYLLDHAIHVHDVIRPKINDNLIICDRYIDSRVAYQSVKLDCSPNDIYDMHFYNYTPRPSMTFVLVCDMDVLSERLRNRDGDLLENTVFLTKVQNAYIQMTKDYPGRCVLIDVTDLTAQEVADAIEFKLATLFAGSLERIEDLYGYSITKIASAPS